jgi:hypothetical protein
VGALEEWITSGCNHNAPNYKHGECAQKSRRFQKIDEKIAIAIRHPDVEIEQDRAITPKHLMTDG